MQWLPAILILPYLFLLLKIFRSLLQIKPFKVSAVPSTFVSLVVACRNEQKNLPGLLNSIALQDYPKELFEVVIVDDNSSDMTYETASRFNGIENIIVIYNNGTGKKQAIRSGINASSGALIITTDADCHMGKRWLRTIAAFYEKQRPDMIICAVQLEPGPGFFRKFQELEFLSLQGITAGSAYSGDGTMCNGANLGFSRETYFDCMNDLHDEIASGDDIFLLHSLKKNKRSKILWLESADTITTTAASLTLGSFIRQRSRWISKTKAYNDRFTICLGIVTFVTISLQLSVLFGAAINESLIGVFLTVFLVKLFPDFMILHNTSVRYGRKDLIYWFLPAEIIYPFYVIFVFFYSIFIKNRNTNSPFPKGI